MHGTCVGAHGNSTSYLNLACKVSGNTPQQCVRLRQQSEALMSTGQLEALKAKQGNMSADSASQDRQYSSVTAFPSNSKPVSLPGVGSCDVKWTSGSGASQGGGLVGAHH